MLLADNDTVPFQCGVEEMCALRSAFYSRVDFPSSGFEIDVSNMPYYYEASVTIQCRLECGPMPNVMAALPNIGGALCLTLQSLADAHY